LVPFPIHFLSLHDNALNWHAADLSIMAVEVASSLALSDQVMREDEDRLASTATSVIQVSDHLVQQSLYLGDRGKQRAGEALEASSGANDTTAACDQLKATTVAVAELQALGDLVSRDPSVSSSC
jgi:hypothetical protein